MGAANGVRTRDPQLGKLMLYRLSYCRNSTTQVILHGAKLAIFLESDKWNTVFLC